MVKVEIIYIKADKTVVQASCSLPNDATVADALASAGLSELGSLPLGIFSNRVSLDTRVNSGDRIEIYRPLQLSPKERRKIRAKRQG